MKYSNVSVYKFYKPSEDLETLRNNYREFCENLGIRGTVLLSPEGVNIFVAGTDEAIESFKQFVSEKTNDPNLFFKISYSDHIPYNRLLVKVKDQIIPMRETGIDPEKDDAPRISAKDFHQWLIEGKDIVVLDTRNDYEVRAGTFKGAQHFNIKHFDDFEKELENCPEEWKEKPIVTFCTGGIRCEKAAPLMVKKGFKNVYQLDGGILHYFEQEKGAFWDGDCFVFDKRVALNKDLQETDHVVCFACRGLVTPQEQKMDTYKYEKYCPHCFDRNSKEETTQSAS